MRIHEAIEYMKLYFKDPKKFIFSNLEKRLVVKKPPKEAKEFIEICSFDLYCPSMQESLRSAFASGSYWRPSEAAKKRHMKCHLQLVKESGTHCQDEDEASSYCEADRQIDRDDILVEESIDECSSHAVAISSDAESESNRMPLIGNLAEVLNSSFVEN